MRGLAAALVIAAWTTAPAAQQPDPALPKHHFTIAGGVSWLGGYPLGGNVATLRRNETGTASPASLTLFRVDTSIEQARAIEARIGYAVTRQLALELGGSYGRPRLALNVSGDAESDGAVFSNEEVSQYSVDVSAVWQISRVRIARRIRPYLAGGGGYLRQLYADRTVVETGRIMHVGGGLRYWLRGGDASSRPLGVRVELRAQSRWGGIDVENEMRTYPVFNLLGFFGF
jgi:hypothetical protein